MRPLLSIQTIPIALEYQVQRASLQNVTAPPTLEVSRNRGGLKIEKEPARLTFDTYEARASIGLKTYSRSIKEFGNSGVAAAQETTAKYAEDAKRIRNSHGKGTPIIDIASAKAAQRVNRAVLDFLPSSGPRFSVEGGHMSIEYVMDQLVFNSNTSHRAEFDYVPGSLEIHVSQYPEVITEYLGEPIYVPPSADPNYEPPVTLDATA